MRPLLAASIFACILVLLIGLSISIDASAQARGQGRPAPPNMPGTFTFIPRADLDAVMGPTRGDRPARVVNMLSGGGNMGEYVLHYPPLKNPMPPSSFYHSEISELYYVIRGQGTALLGGELENPTWRPDNTASFRQVSGPGVAGTLKNYKTQKWGPGDIIIVPAGVPHTIGFEVTVTNDILRVVIDPKRVLNPVNTREQSLALARAEAQEQGERQSAPARPGPPNMPGTFTFIPKADVEAQMGPTRGDRPVRVVPIANNANLGAFILHYETMKNTLPVNSFYHSEISELYYVIRGAGTALLGGEMQNPTWDDSKSDAIRQVRGPSVNGTMKNYQTVKWTAGDTVIVPAGVPHSMGFEVTEKTDILRVVFDPKKSIQPK
jgi:oxalate decarboxylase/phosphoglucose isomerase-like protein (cupin superfamily)